MSNIGASISIKAGHDTRVASPQMAKVYLDMMQVTIKGHMEGFLRSSTLLEDNNAGIEVGVRVVFAWTTRVPGRVPWITVTVTIMVTVTVIVTIMTVIMLLTRKVVTVVAITVLAVSSDAGSNFIKFAHVVIVGKDVPFPWK